MRPLLKGQMPVAALDLIAQKVYGATGVNMLPAAASKLVKFEQLGFGHPLCVAKTQSSFSDDPKKLGRPRDFEMKVRDVKLAAGAGFVVAYAGEILTMPGLPKIQSAESRDIDSLGNTVGLF
jgi:formate--tetrahydrofolate ligase